METTAELAILKKDADGNIIINNDGNVTCISEGVEYEIDFNEINFNNDNLELSIDGKRIIIPLHNNNDKENTTANGQDIFSWSDSSTKLFLTLYKDYSELLTKRKIKTKKMMWDRIALEMQKNGYNVTTVQVENKYKSLERSYKNMKSNNKKTGRSRMSCAFEAELTELLGSKHNIEPLAVCGSEGLIVRESERINMSLDSNVNNPMISNNNNTHNPEISRNNSNTDNLQILRDNNNNPEIAGQSNEDQASTTNIQSKKKNDRKHLGATARMLESCQKTIEKFATNVEDDSNNKCSVQKDILEEYRKMRLIQEEYIVQLKRANDLKEEKNRLLKEIFLDLQNKNK